MATDLQRRLRMILEGVLLEAEDDKYDLPKQADEDGTPVSEPVTEEPDDSDQTPNNTEPTDDPDTSEEDGGGDTGATTSDNIGDGEPDGSEEETEEPPEESPPGELLPLDATSRKLLAYKNFGKYRALRDSVSRFISNLSTLPSSTSENRTAIVVAIEKATSLLEKMDDYIVYRYQQNSYEVNYANFMQFVVEKRLIQNIIDETRQTEDRKDNSKQ